MEAVESANQLPSEYFEAVQSAPFLAAKIEVEGVPMRVRIAGVMPEDVEIRVPFSATVADSNGAGQRPVEGVALGDPEQLGRGLVDEERQFLELIVEQSVAGVHVELAFDRRNGRVAAEDDTSHGL